MLKKWHPLLFLYNIVIRSVARRLSFDQTGLEFLNILTNQNDNESTNFY